MAVDPRAEAEGRILAETLWKTGMWSAAVGFTDDAYGRASYASFVRALEGYGMSVTAAVIISNTSVGFSAQLAHLAAAGGDVLVLLGDLGAEGARQFIREALDLGAFERFAVNSPWLGVAFDTISSDPFTVYGASTSGTGTLLSTLIYEGGVLERVSYAQAGGTGADATYFGSFASELMLGSRGSDALIGFAGRDTLVGYDGADYFEGGSGADLLQSGPGADFIFGGGEPDTIQGGGGHDTIYGGSGADKITGGSGNDVINGGRGNDLLIGNDGADRFEFRAHDGRDVIRDFDSSQGDSLYLDPAIWGGGLTIAEVVQRFGTVTATGVTLRLTATDSIVVTGAQDFDDLAAHVFLLS